MLNQCYIESSISPGQPIYLPDPNSPSQPPYQPKPDFSNQLTSESDNPSDMRQNAFFYTISLPTAAFLLAAMPVVSLLLSAPTFLIACAGVIPIPFNLSPMLAIFMQDIFSASTFLFACAGKIPTAFCQPAVPSTFLISNYFFAHIGKISDSFVCLILNNSFTMLLIFFGQYAY